MPLERMSSQFIDPESLRQRWVYTAIALLIAVGFFTCVMIFWVPAHSGTDQNGYLFGGKNISQSLTMRYAPVRPGTNDFDPHQFVGRMWVGADLGTPAERYYPKYPAGLPFLYAIALWIGALFKPGTGVILSYLISPLAMSIAVFTTFIIARLFTGSFFALLAMIVFATSPVTVGLATNPNSHAAAVCCVSGGMFLLLRYWQNGGILRALPAGFLLGYAGTVRYSEATLILPIVLVVLFTFPFEKRRITRRWLSQSFVLLIGWAIPVAALVLYNHSAFGTTTGYDPTHESSGFRLSYATDNWETMFRQLDTNGLSLLLPLSLAGLFWMFWWNWQAAMVLTAWIVPCMITYLFYYWAPDTATVSYLRFFTTILPALAVCFFWLATRARRLALQHAVDRRRHLSRWLTVAAVVIVLPIAWLSSMRLWLGDYSAELIGVRETSRAVQTMLPPDAAVDIDIGNQKAARVGLVATFGWAIAGGCAAGLMTLAAVRGKAALPDVGAGLLTALVAGMHLTNALPLIDNDQILRSALLDNVNQIRAVVPAGSIIFGDQQTLNDIQFVGNYTLYDGQSFNRDWVNNLPNSEPPDSPQGLDPGRRDALYHRLNNFDQNALNDQARKIVLDAIASRRRVFVIVPRRDTDQRLRKQKVKLAAAKPPKTPAKPPANPRQNLAKSMPDIVQRLCAGDRLTFDVAESWFTYVPRVAVNNNSPRGLRVPRTDPPPTRRGMELIEIAPAPST